MPAAQRTPQPPLVQDTSMPVNVPAWVTLPQSNGRPYRFQGTAIAEANGYRSGARMWYTIAMFARATRGYVALIRSYQKSPDFEDFARLIRADTLADLTTALEAYDPDADAGFAKHPDGAEITPTQAMLQAAQLRAALDEARGGYRALIGDFLFEISALEPGVG